MGAAGPDAYLIGVTEGNSVLDAARAAVTYLSIPDTGHGLVALRALPTLMPWFRDALGGTAPGAASALCASN